MKNYKDGNNFIELYQDIVNDAISKDKFNGGFKAFSRFISNDGTSLCTLPYNSITTAIFDEYLLFLMLKPYEYQGKIKNYSHSSVVSYISTLRRAVTKACELELIPYKIVKHFDVLNKVLKKQLKF